MTPVYAIFRDSASSLQIVCMLRIINAFIATATLYVIYRFAKEVTKNHTTSLIAIILFGSWPTFFHAAGYASNDILLTLLCGLLFYLVAKTNTYNLRTVIQLSVVTGLALCTKLFAVFMMPLVLVKLLMSHGKKLLDRKLITAVLLYTVSSLLIGGWYYAQNYVVTGDLVSADISKAEIGEAGEIVQDRHQMTYDDFDYEPYTWQGVKVVFSPNGLNLGYQWVRNYIGVFGWGQKPLRRDILFIFMGTYGLLLIAAIPALLKNKRYWVYFIPFLLLFSILIYKNYMSAFFWDGWIRALSGRYYLYSSIPIFTAMAIGYNSILQKLQYKNVAMLASMVVLFLIEWRIFIREIVVWIYF
ncbi:MAG: glycosyltransferase family 39 protein [Pseudomonadales bacterium]|nr:glycosyltransferase family 39 protein [Pseudomonadales bacterium]